MGESLVDTTSYGKKKERSVASCGRLEVSVSFGKFDSDSLSWEKFSTFSPNKYLEEVEKCATPGSVAEKKAYFEAHYKKIAARKAEQLDQEKHDETTPQKGADESCQDSVLHDGELGYAPNCKSYAEGDPRETDVKSSNHIDKLDEDPTITTIRENLPLKEAKVQVDTAEGSHPEARPVLVEEEQEKETSSKEPQETKESPHNRNNETIGAQDTEKDKLKLVRAKESQKIKLERSKEAKKVTPVNKERNVAKTKPVSPMSKHITTPKVSKPVATTPSMLSSRFSTKRTTGTSSPKRRISTAGKSKKLTSKSLDMPLGLGPSNSDMAPLSTARRSFIMEQMGDKDIVKSVFKSFQKNSSPSKSSSEDISSAPRQILTKGKQPKVYAPMTPKKLIGSSLRTASQDKKNAKAAPVSCVPKSSEHVEKQKKSTKNLASNRHEKEAERTRSQTRIKDDKYSDIRKSRQTPNNIKHLSVPGLNRGQKLTKSSLDEVYSFCLFRVNQFFPPIVGSNFVIL